MLVNILNENIPIERRVCRRVRLPDGRSGVVWRGLAYPLEHDGVSVNAALEGIAPELCGRPAPEGPSAAYVLIEGATETYMLVNGSVVDRERAVGQLRVGGLEVLRTGRYLGEPVEGLTPDWFIRVATPAHGLDALRTSVIKTLGMSAPAPTAGTALRLALVVADLTAARAREVHDRAEIERLRILLGQRTSNEAELASLQQAFHDESLARQALEAAVASKPSDPQPNTSPPAAAKRFGEEVEDVLSTLLPRVILIRNCVTLILAEFVNRRRLYAALLELERAEADVHPKWKALKGASKWIERHVSNGQDDAGRIYARRRLADRKWDVLVSHKGEQARDIAWLRAKA